MGTHSDPFPAGSQAAATFAASENPLYLSFALRTLRPERNVTSVDSMTARFRIRSSRSMPCLTPRPRSRFQGRGRGQRAARQYGQLQTQCKGTRAVAEDDMMGTRRKYDPPEETVYAHDADRPVVRNGLPPWVVDVGQHHHAWPIENRVDLHFVGSLLHNIGL